MWSKRGIWASDYDEAISEETNGWLSAWTNHHEEEVSSSSSTTTTTTADINTFNTVDTFNTFYTIINTIINENINKIKINNNNNWEDDEHLKWTSYVDKDANLMDQKTVRTQMGLVLHRIGQVERGVRRRILSVKLAPLIAKIKEECNMLMNQPVVRRPKRGVQDDDLSMVNELVHMIERDWKQLGNQPNRATPKMRTFRKCRDILCCEFRNESEKLRFMELMENTCWLWPSERACMQPLPQSNYLDNINNDDYHYYYYDDDNEDNINNDCHYNYYYYQQDNDNDCCVSNQTHDNDCCVSNQTHDYYSSSSSYDKRRLGMLRDFIVAERREGEHFTRRPVKIMVRPRRRRRGNGVLWRVVREALKRVLGKNARFCDFERGRMINKKKGEEFEERVEEIRFKIHEDGFRILFANFKNELILTQADADAAAAEVASLSEWYSKMNINANFNRHVKTYKNLDLDKDLDKKLQLWVDIKPKVCIRCHKLNKGDSQEHRCKWVSCRKCGRYGHIKPECTNEVYMNRDMKYSKYRYRKEYVKYCNNCKQPGHTAMEQMRCKTSVRFMLDSLRNMDFPLEFLETKKGRKMIHKVAYYNYED